MMNMTKEDGFIIMDDSNLVGVRSAINKFLVTNCELVQDFNMFSCYKKL
jgi:hypothetical protein